METHVDLHSAKLKPGRCHSLGGLLLDEDGPKEGHPQRCQESEYHCILYRKQLDCPEIAPNCSKAKKASDG